MALLLGILLSCVLSSQASPSSFSSQVKGMGKIVISRFGDPHSFAFHLEKLNWPPNLSPKNLCETCARGSRDAGISQPLEDTFALVNTKCGIFHHRSMAESIPENMGFRIDSESILYSKEKILFPILRPKMVILNKFRIVGNQNRLNPTPLPKMITAWYVRRSDSRRSIWIGVEIAPQSFVCSTSGVTFTPSVREPRI